MREKENVQQCIRLLGIMRPPRAHQTHTNIVCVCTKSICKFHLNKSISSFVLRGIFVERHGYDDDNVNDDVL